MSTLASNVLHTLYQQQGLMKNVSYIGDSDCMCNFARQHARSDPNIPSHAHVCLVSLPAGSSPAWPFTPPCRAGVITTRGLHPATSNPTNTGTACCQGRRTVDRPCQHSRYCKHRGAKVRRRMNGGGWRWRKKSRGRGLDSLVLSRVSRSSRRLKLVELNFP